MKFSVALFFPLRFEPTTRGAEVRFGCGKYQDVYAYLGRDHQSPKTGVIQRLELYAERDNACQS